jgi:hypothetical protein
MLLAEKKTERGRVILIESAPDQKADHRSKDRIDKFNDGMPENLNLQTKHCSIEEELVDGAESWRHSPRFLSVG